MSKEMKARTANHYINLYESGVYLLICVHSSKGYLIDEMLGAIMGAKLQDQTSADSVGIVKDARWQDEQYLGVRWPITSALSNDIPKAILDGLRNIVQVYPMLTGECEAIRTSLKNYPTKSFLTC